jgi:hypothetical protein
MPRPEYVSELLFQDTSRGGSLRITHTILALGLAGVLGGVTHLTAQQEISPAFTSTGELVLPTGYREWVFVGTGLGMTYGPTQRPSTLPAAFENIYVPREAYRVFMQSGRWPERTIFIMEGRSVQSHQLLANVGQTQGDALYIEASVKDTARFPYSGWAYFNFGGQPNPRPTARPLATTIDCYRCHVENTAVENTFVQYYPALFEAARKFGTIKPMFDPRKRF